MHFFLPLVDRQYIISILNIFCVKANKYYKIIRRNTRRAQLMSVERNALMSVDKKRKKGKQTEGEEDKREGRRLGRARAQDERRQQKASRTEGRVPPPRRRRGGTPGGRLRQREKVEVIIPLEQWPHDLAYASRSMSHGH